MYIYMLYNIINLNKRNQRMKRTIILAVFICISVTLTCQEMTRWYQSYDQYKLYKKCTSDQGTKCLITEEAIEEFQADQRGDTKHESETINYKFKKILYFDGKNQMAKIRLILPIMQTEKISFADIVQNVSYRMSFRQIQVFTEIVDKNEKTITIDIMPVKYRIDVLMGKAQNFTGCNPTKD